MPGVDAAATALPHPQCPLCDQLNHCAPAACGRLDVDCWCATVTIAPATLARIAPARRGRACLCPACAAGLSPPAGDPPS